MATIISTEKTPIARFTRVETVVAADVLTAQAAAFIVIDVVAIVTFFRTVGDAVTTDHSAAIVRAQEPSVTAFSWINSVVATDALGAQIAAAVVVDVVAVVALLVIFDPGVATARFTVWVARISVFARASEAGIEHRTQIEVAAVTHGTGVRGIDRGNTRTSV